MASGMMYLRLAALLAIFSRDLMLRLAPAFIALAAAAIGAGWFWLRRSGPLSATPVKEPAPSNPLELRAAFLFALLFLAMLVVTQLAILYLGDSGVLRAGPDGVDPIVRGAVPLRLPLRAAPRTAPRRWRAPRWPVSRPAAGTAGSPERRRNRAAAGGRAAPWSRPPRRSRACPAPRPDE